jgi:hypothetical protein
MKSIKPLGIAAIVLAAIAVGALGIASVIAAATGVFDFGAGAREGVGIDERKTFPAGGITLVSVANTSYDVRVSDSPDDAVNVRLHGTARGLKAEEVPYLVSDLAGGVLKVSTERRARFQISLRGDRIILEIGLPASYRGGISIVSGSGNVSVGEHRYSEASVRSTSGDIDIASISADLDARATSGNISVAFAEGPGSSVIRASSGDVKVSLPSSAGFSIDARTSSGDIESEMPVLSEQGRDRHRLMGTVGTPGSASLRIVTTSGDVRIRKI